MDRFDEAKTRVKEATDLVALIEGYVPLRARGRTMVALCPFHQEKTPSFTVYPESQHFNCYGCGKAGDVFTFVMEREGLSFREALEMLAERAGISLDGVFGAGPRDRNRGPDPHRVLAEVRDWLRQQLESGEGAAARKYLAERGLDAAREGFGIGYHPGEASTASLREFAAERKLPRDVLEQAGLLRRAREPFAGRLMFPIEDERGRVVGFGGRLLPGTPEAEPRGDYTPPKYVNSPESPFFNKRRVLFGLRQVKQAGCRRVVVMEGYTDVIAGHLAGFSGAVATLGTALTADHARMLERYATDGLVLLFDGDRAGRQAAERALRELVNSRLRVSIALAEEGLDPADLLAGDDPDEGHGRFQALLDGAGESLTVWFRLLRQRIDLTEAVGVELAARECAGVLAGVESPVRRQALVRDMARHLGVSAPALGRMVRPRSGAPGHGAAPQAAPPEDGQAGAQPAGAVRPGRPSPVQAADRELLSCVLAAPALVERARDEVCEDPAVTALLELVGDAVAAGHTERPGLVRELFTSCTERQELAPILAEAAERAAAIANPVAFLDTLQAGRRRFAARQTARQIRQQLQQAMAAGDQAAADDLTRRYYQHKLREN